MKKLLKKEWQGVESENRVVGAMIKEEKTAKVSCLSAEKEGKGVEKGSAELARWVGELTR